MIKGAAIALALALAVGCGAGTAEPHDPVHTRVIELAPKAADKPETTHAALLLSRQVFAAPFTFAGRVTTIRQLRVGSPPNPWECAWLVWDYRDPQHFYYVALKPNGWELGKRDPAYPGGQRFLASGEARFPAGAWHAFAIRQARNVIAVRLDGVEIVSYVDTERPYLAGGLGLYAEDAEVELDDVTAPFADDFEDYPLLRDGAEGRVINNWTAPFLGYGHIAVIERKR